MIKYIKIKISLKDKLILLFGNLLSEDILKMYALNNNINNIKTNKVILKNEEKTENIKEYKDIKMEVPNFFDNVNDVESNF